MPNPRPAQHATLFSVDGGAAGLTTAAFEDLIEQVAQEWVLDAGVERLLLLPPDHTRLYSQAGRITMRLWRRLSDRVEIDILPALGTHFAMSEGQIRLMFGDDAPLDRFIPHRWRDDLHTLGELPEELLTRLSGGAMRSSVEVAVNRRIVSGDYDLVLSIGQVVPHEVIGFANYTKNVCIGCGGGDMLHKSHMLGAVCGVERVLGEVDTPVRELVDTGFDQFVRPQADVRFLLTVVQDTAEGPQLRAITAGRDAECFRWAAELSREVNLTRVERPIRKCVVYLDPREFSSTWLGNKAVYRTRKALADNGELIVLAPAVETFGEDPEIDRLIRRYGYRGTPQTLAAVQREAELGGNLSAAAHLIHGSSEGRFSITYCTGDGLTAEEVRSVGYDHRPYHEVAKEYRVESLSDGWHTGPDGEPFYFIRNPALGLWTV